MTDNTQRVASPPMGAGAAWQAAWYEQNARDRKAAEPKPATVAWLLEADGTVTELVEARRSVWPGAATVTLTDGTKKSVNARNVLAGDDLDRRYFA